LSSYNDGIAMALELVGYFDASGHPDQGKVLTVGGYIGDVRAWSRFDRVWSETLADVGLEQFHMADFMSDRQWDSRRDEVLSRLVLPIRRNTRRGLATMIYLEDWREVSEIYDLRRCKCTPYALAGLQTMVKAMTFIRRKNQNAKVAFVFEDGDRTKATSCG
jgi:hypothetical protein